MEYTKTITGNLGADSRTVKKIGAKLGFTGGMVAAREFTKSVAGVTTLVAGGTTGKLFDKTMGGTVELVGGSIGTTSQPFEKSILGALGSPVVSTSKTSEPAVLGLTGSMSKSMIYGETMAGFYPPFVWMDDDVKPPTLTFTGGFAKTVNGTNVVDKGVSASLALTGGMDGSVPQTYDKTITAEIGFTVPARSSVGCLSRDGRRSLRWIRRRRRRRDTW